MGSQHVQDDEHGFAALAGEIHRMLHRVVRPMLVMRSMCVMMRVLTIAVGMDMKGFIFRPRHGMINVPFGREMNCNEIDVEGKQNRDKQPRPTSRQERAPIQCMGESRLVHRFAFDRRME
jgi:hypothetical protein